MRKLKQMVRQTHIRLLLYFICPSMYLLLIVNGAHPERANLPDIFVAQKI